MKTATILEKPYETVIIGGGPAGSSMAAVLADAGITTLVVDKRREVGSPVQCAEFISRAGFAGPAAAVAQPIENMVTHMPDGSTHVSRSPGYTIHRDIFDSSLAERAMDKGAVYLLGAVATITDRCVVAAKKIRRPVSAKVIVDATGGGRAAHAARSRQVTLSLARPLEDIHVWLGPLFPGGYAWIFPKNDMANVGVAVTAQLDLKRVLERFIRSVESEFGLGGRPARLTGGKIPVSGVASLVDGNIVRVGDAAGVTHPVSGEGICRAVRSGEIAGEVVARNVRSGNGASLTHYVTKMMDIYGAYFSRDKQKRIMWEKAVRAGGPTPGQYRRLWIGCPEYYRSDMQ